MIPCGRLVYMAKGVLHLLDLSGCASFLHFEHIIKVRSSLSILSFSSVSSNIVRSRSACSFTIFSLNCLSAGYLSSWGMLLCSMSYMQSYK